MIFHIHQSFSCVIIHTNIYKCNVYKMLITKFNLHDENTLCVKTIYMYNL